MILSIGCDHAGYELKEKIKQHLDSRGLAYSDFGTNSVESTDYPDYAHRVAEKVVGSSSSFGILLCGSANGVCMTANKHHGIRAALCWNVEIARLARQHNNANIICIPARYVDEAVAFEMIDVFMKTEFEGGRHQKRIDKIDC